MYIAIGLQKLNAMAVKSTSEEAVMKATGKVWDEWMTLLEQRGAAKLNHTQIAALLHEEYDVAAWWAQTITVEYERMIGRREVGQSCTGTYQASASKTLPGTMEAVYMAWQDHMKGKDNLNDVPYEQAPTTSETEKWRYWRVALVDGSKPVVTITQKAEGKVHLAVNHDKLNDTDAVAAWKIYWKECFKEFADQM